MDSSGLFINDKSISFTPSNIALAIAKFNFDIYSIDEMSCVDAARIIKSLIIKQHFSLVMLTIIATSSNTTNMLGEIKLIVASKALLMNIEAFPEYTVIIT
jgi:hypothetical protein